MVRNTPPLEPHLEVEAAKARLRSAFEQVGAEFQQTADQLQNRVVETAQEVQERVQGTTDHIGDKVQAAVNGPAEAIRKRPLEAVAATLTAGLIVGLLNRPNQKKTDSSPSTSSSGLISGLVAGGLGKIIWDTVREEYLTPENIRHFLRRATHKGENQP